MNIRCISHNVQGFNSPNKRKKAFHHYKRLGAKIVLIQETHFAYSNHPKFFHKAFNQSYYTLFPSICRGVAIFIHNSFPFEVQDVYKDKDSRFLILKGRILGRALTIANIYAPNEASSSFFHTFFDTLDKFYSPHIILGGDFNMVAHPSLDRSNPSSLSKISQNLSLKNCKAYN